jgi:integral membrane protein
MKRKLIHNFRKIAFLEGVSYLVLLLIAMPLKYFAGMPQAVKYVGWAHGLLFVLYMGLLGLLWIKKILNHRQTLYSFVAAFVPLATFVLEKKLKDVEETL